MGTIGNLMVKIGADIGGLQRGLNLASASVSRFATGSVRAIGATAAGFTAGMAVIGASAGAAAVGVYKLSTAASDLAESQNVVAVTFGKSGEAINKWATTVATSAGIGTTSATKMVGTMGSILKSSTGNVAAAEQMSKQIVQLSGDLASFKNINAQDAFEKIRSGLLGESEPLKQIGYVMNETTMETYRVAQGFKTAFSEMSEGDKVMLRYNYLMSLTKDAQGDYINTSEGMANSTRALKLNFENLSTTIGSMFMPAVTEAIRGTSTILTDINQTLSDGFQESDIEKIGSRISDGLISGMTKIVEYTPKIVSILSKVLSSAIKVLVTTMPQALPPLVKGILDMFQSAFDAVKNNGKAITNMMDSLVQQILDFIINNAADIIAGGVQIIISLAVGLVKAIPKLIGKIPEIIAGIVDTFINYDWAGVGASIMQAISEGGKSINMFAWYKPGYSPTYGAPAISAGVTGTNGILNAGSTSVIGANSKTKGIADPFANILDPFSKTGAARSAAQKTIASSGPMAGYENAVRQQAVVTGKAVGATKPFVAAINDVSTGATNAKGKVDTLKTAVQGLVDAMQTKTTSFTNFVGIFDVFQRTAVSAERVINRLKGQVKAMQEWRASLSKLEARGVSTQFVNELRNMGPGSVDYVKTVANMTDAQLAQTTGLVAEKYKIGGEQAAKSISGDTNIQTKIDTQINLSVTGSKADADAISDTIVKKLRVAGIRI